MHLEGFGKRLGFGRHPALVVVDMTLGFTDPASPLGGDLEETIEQIRRLLDGARQAEIPVIFTTVAYGESEKLTAAAFIEKIPALLALEAGSRWAETWDLRIAPREDEAVINKLFQSSFFGTPLGTLLTTASVDTLIVTGASTSGCIRATVFDAIQHGYRPIIPGEAVGDRNPTAHEANLYDMDAKNGDVVAVEEVLEYLEEVHATHAR